MTDTPTMTRAEAVCACTNIIEAVEVLDEILPAEYSKSVHERTKSISDYIKSTPQFPHVTEKMDKYLRNTWTGLMKWNRKGVAQNDLFYGLADHIEAAATTKRAADDVGDDDLPDETEEPQEGIEDTRTAEAMLKGVALPRVTPAAVVAAPRLVSDAPTIPNKPVASASTLVLAKFEELAVKACENVISMVLARFRERNIRVIDVAKIKHGDLSPITKMTSSDRNQQLIEAGWLSGYIAGAKSAKEELQELLKKEK